MFNNTFLKFKRYVLLLHLDLRSRGRWFGAHWRHSLLRLECFVFLVLNTRMFYSVEFECFLVHLDFHCKFVQKVQ